MIIVIVYTLPSSKTFECVIKETGIAVVICQGILYYFGRLWRIRGYYNFLVINTFL